MPRIAIPESIEKKLAKAQSRLLKLKTRYDAAAAEVEMLLKRRDELKQKELLEAFVASGRSYEEVLEFLRPKRSQTNSTADDEESDRE